MINNANSVEEVCKIIQELLENEMISVSTLLEVIEQDHNLLSSSVCNDIISKVFSIGMT